MKHAARNVRRVAERQLPRPWVFEVEPGVRIGQSVQPIESVGCYIPGGRHALVSTLVMTAIPAILAGVARVIAVCPHPSAELLAAAGALGVTEIARIGGAQAIAALAYGTRSIPRVEKIFGPGNRFVTAAKQLVSRDCAMDLPAGPTEAIVLAYAAIHPGLPQTFLRRPSTLLMPAASSSPHPALLRGKCRQQSLRNCCNYHATIPRTPPYNVQEPSSSQARCAKLATSSIALRPNISACRRPMARRATS